MNIKEATAKIESYLASAEERMNTFGSALPGYVDPQVKLQIVKTEEYEFGWVFYYDNAEFLRSGDFSHALAGNAPIIINRVSGDLVETGSARDSSFYIDNYIRTGDPHDDPRA